MKRNNKKGFTIVELVIVIAVIAILSAVLIPTFGGIVEKANESARDQEATNIMKEYLIDHNYVTTPLENVDGYILVDDYLYTVTDGNVDTAPEQTQGSVPTGYVAVNGVYLACTSHVDADAEGTEGAGVCDLCGATIQ